MERLTHSSRLYKINPVGDSVRTVIPVKLAKILGWKAGDELIWKVLPKSKAILVFKLDDSLIKLEDEPQFKTEIQEVTQIGNKNRK